MARVSRKRPLANSEQNQEEKAKMVYNTAIYARLSREDNLTGSDSIEHQIEIAEGYIKSKPYLHYVGTYADNGYTGTDFNRPEWQKLMEQMRRGTVNCIVVKDLSRVGRNYIETGEFIEKICPFFSTRLISVNDGFDTATAVNEELLSVTLQNIINDYYAKDISRKVSTALRVKVERGDYIGKWEKYGYVKDPDNKNHLIVNPETAPVVKQIFDWRAEGVSYSGIDRKLNELGIPSPGQYKADRGIITNNNQKPQKILWNKHMVTIILNDIVYIGHLAQRKDTQCLYVGKPLTHEKSQDWIIVENTHEPIIDAEVFYKVQRMNQETAEKYRAMSLCGWHDNLPRFKNVYGKKFTCADCGATIKLVRAVNSNRTKAYCTFKCPRYLEHGTLGCNAKRITKEALDQVVIASLKAQFDLFLDMKKAFEELRSMGKVHLEKELENQEISEAKKTLDTKKAIFGGLYRDYHEGLLTEEDYFQARAIISEEIEQINQKIQEIEETRLRTSVYKDDFQEWEDLIKQYYEVNEVSAELVDAMIESMQMHEDSSITIKFKHMDSFDKILKVIQGAKSEVTS